MAQALVAVCGQYVAADGSAPNGTITFTPRVNGATDQAELDILGNQPVVAALDSTGSFSVTLFPTDDPARIPLGWTYRVDEWLAGGTRRSYDITVPIAAAGGPCLSLATLAPVASISGSNPVGPTLSAFTAEVVARGVADANIKMRSKSLLPLNPETAAALLPVMAFPPRVTNTGPNSGPTVGNPVLYPVWVLAPDNVAKIVNPTPPWLLRGYARDAQSLILAANPGGPYLFPNRASDPSSFAVGPLWLDFWTDAPDMELSYLSGLASLVRWLVQDDSGPNGSGLRAVSPGPVALTSTGGNQFRYRLSFGLDPIAPPSVTLAGGGTLAAAVYRYRITTVDLNGGETPASNQGSVTTAGGNRTVNLTWAAPTNTANGNADRTIASYNVYRTVAGGAGTEQLVGNVPAGTLAFSDTGIAEGGATLTHILFGTSGRRLRRIVLECHYLFFGGITLDKADTIYPAIAPTSRVLWVGDSLTGATAASFTPFGYAAQASERLGLLDPDILGYGGTGYVSTNPPLGKFQDRLSDITYTPDLIITAGGRNDVGQSDAAITAGVAAYLAAVKAKWPNSPHVVLAPWYSATAPVVHVGDLIKAVCAAANVPYVDLLALKIITGTGTSAAPVGDGNADVVMFSDGTHWVTAGHTLVAQAVAAQIEAVLALVTIPQ